MKTEFSDFYPPTPEEVSKLWECATFVLDANVLLDLYRYPSDVRDSLINALAAIADRIWIPHQAALEYQYNRPAVIAKQMNRFAELRQTLEKHRTEVGKSIDQLQLKKRHSTIDPDAFLSQLDSVIDKFIESLTQSQSAHPDVHTDDPIRDILDSKIIKHIGPAYSSEELSEIYDEGKKRYERRQPPGFKDAKEKEGEVRIWNDTVIRREYGDLILWKQLLRHATEGKLSHVILVTSDEKPDWWWTVRSNGPKKLGPRPELVQEIAADTPVQCFQMYTSVRFLAHASQHLDLKLPENTLDRLRSFNATDTKLFGDLSNAKLRERTLSLVVSIRERLAQWSRESDATRHNRQSGQTEEERQESSDRMNREYSEAMTSLKRDYSRHFKIDAILLRDALAERLGTSNTKVRSSYEHFTTTHCMNEVVDDLERMAKQLV